jgi:hypothetical protein
MDKPELDEEEDEEFFEPGELEQFAMPDYLERDMDGLLAGRKKPKGWKYLTYYDQLDWIATRILAEDRHGITSHQEIKDSGILSVSQYERRRNREVHSEFGSLDVVKPTEGVFSRTHVRDLRGRKLRIRADDGE